MASCSPIGQSAEKRIIIIIMKYQSVGKILPGRLCLSKMSFANKPRQRILSSSLFSRSMSNPTIKPRQRMLSPSVFSRSMSNPANKPRQRMLSPSIFSRSVMPNSVTKPNVMASPVVSPVVVEAEAEHHTAGNGGLMSYIYSWLPWGNKKQTTTTETPTQHSILPSVAPQLANRYDVHNELPSTGYPPITSLRSIYDMKKYRIGRH